MTPESTARLRFRSNNFFCQFLLDKSVINRFISFRLPPPNRRATRFRPDLTLCLESHVIWRFRDLRVPLICTAAFRRKGDQMSIPRIPGDSLLQ